MPSYQYPVSNQFHFNWPHYTTTIKNVWKTFTTTTEVPKNQATESSVMSTVFSTITPTITERNNTVVFGDDKITTSPTITDLFNSNRTMIMETVSNNVTANNTVMFGDEISTKIPTITDLFDSNRTMIMEAVANNATTIVGMDRGNNTSMINGMDVVNTTMFTEITQNNLTAATDSTLMSETVTSAIDNTITKSTERIVTTINDLITTTTTVATTTTGNDEGITENFHHQNEVVSGNLLFIVLGIILGVLMVITVILVLIYKKYKFKHQNGGYTITETKNLSGSSGHDTEQTQCQVPF